MSLLLLLWLRLVAHHLEPPARLARHHAQCNKRGGEELLMRAAQARIESRRSGPASASGSQGMAYKVIYTPTKCIVCYDVHKPVVPESKAGWLGTGTRVRVGVKRFYFYSS